MRYDTPFALLAFWMVGLLRLPYEELVDRSGWFGKKDGVHNRLAKVHGLDWLTTQKVQNDTVFS